MSFTIENSHYNLVISTDCTACGMCIATCPTSALSTSRNAPKTNRSLCNMCYMCIEICPRDAISFHQHLLPEIGVEFVGI